MKLQFKPRELALMTLPAVLLGGTAWWLGSGGQMRAHLPDLNNIALNTRRPSLSFQRVAVSWTSPTEDAISYSQEVGCSLATFVDASADWKQARPSTVPSFAATTVVDNKGRSLNTILVGNLRAASAIPIPFSTGTSWTTHPTQAVPDEVYCLGSQIPFRYMPANVRSATFYGTVAWGTSTPVHVKVDVLPVWMRRPASRLRLTSAKWKPAPHSQGGQIEVVCHLTNARKPCVFGNKASAAVSALGMGFGYNPTDEWLATPPGSDVILAEWSQRVESGDGKINSLVRLKDYTLKAIYAGGVPTNLSPSHRKILDKFAPLATFPNVTIKEDVTRLTYSVNSIPPLYKNPVFCCDIFLVGDGKISVRCPLTKLVT